MLNRKLSLHNTKKIQILETLIELVRHPSTDKPWETSLQMDFLEAREEVGEGLESVEGSGAGTAMGSRVDL